MSDEDQYEKWKKSQDFAHSLYMDKDLEKIMEEDGLPKSVAVSVVCGRHDFSYISKDLNTYCKTPYECMYKTEGSDRCMNQKKKYVSDIR